MSNIKNTWWYKGLVNNFQKIWIEAILPIIFFLCLLIYWFGVGQPFERKWIEPVSQPDIFVRIFYSALTFFTIGAFLYWIRFYQVLHDIFVKELGEKGLYRNIKMFIWWSLMGIMFFVIVPTVVDIINFSISVLYNVLQFILYSLPVFGISIILIIIIYLSYVYIKEIYYK